VKYLLIVALMLLGCSGDNCSCPEDDDDKYWASGFEAPPNGNGLDDAAYCAAVYGNDLIVGGRFTQGAMWNTERIGKWDGTKWRPLGSGMTHEEYADVRALKVFEGDLIAGGRIREAGDSLVNNIARWDGDNWHSLAGGVGGSHNEAWVNSMVIYEGDLIVGGWFGSAGGTTVRDVARWDGEAWHPMGDGTPDDCYALIVYSGRLIAGGRDYIVEWNGSSWESFEGVNDIESVWALCVYGDVLVVGGCFETIDGLPLLNIAIWNGESWQAVGNDLDWCVRELGVYKGDLIVGGYFTEAEGSPGNHIARWDGSAWHPLGSGTDGVVGGLEVYQDQLYVVGEFTSAGNKASANIAEWNR
jgi:hypothetical protein